MYITNFKETVKKEFALKLQLFFPLVQQAKELFGLLFFVSVQTVLSVQVR